MLFKMRRLVNSKVRQERSARAFRLEIVGERSVTGFVSSPEITSCAAAISPQHTSPHKWRSRELYERTADGGLASRKYQEETSNPRVAPLTNPAALDRK